MKWGRGLVVTVAVLAPWLAAIAAEAQERPTQRRARALERGAERPERRPLGMPPSIQGLSVEFSKAFEPDTIGSGSVSTLRFEIDNNQGVPVTDLAFVDNLPAGMTISSFPNVVSECGGTVTAPGGGTTISFTDGTLAADAECSISVDVTSSTSGVSTNVTGDLTSSAGNSGTATDDLTVDDFRPGFSKSFSPSSVGLGGRSTLTFVIDNTASEGTAFNLEFVDNLPDGMTIADPSNASTDCSGNVLTAEVGTSLIALSFPITGVSSLPGGASCGVSVDVVSDTAGAVGNASESLFSGDSAFATGRDSGKANALLDVAIDPIVLIKSFTDDPVNPGDTVNLEFTVLNRDRDFAATGISFSDDLDATLSGLVATGLPANGVCGMGSTLSGTDTISLVGGDLPADASCTFSVTLQVPAAAAAGVYPNATSTITADVDGSAVAGVPALDSLAVSNAPVLTKAFLSNPVGAGAALDLEFTLTNPSSTLGISDIAFLDDLTASLSGVVVTTLPATGFCGAGSQAFLSGGLNEQIFNVAQASLAPGGSCTFQIGLQLPQGIPGGDYLNVTSDVTATVEDETATSSPASDVLTVVAAPLLTKTFTDDPVAAGDTVTLEFTLSLAAGAPADATGIGFTDDLSAALAGLEATGLPMNDVCGAGSSIDGTSSLTFAGGTLSPDSSCTFSVTLQTPAAALPGTYTNTTSAVTATVAGVPVVGPGAEDGLIISGLSLTKTFVDDPVLPGSTVELEFTLANTSATSTATAITFTDELADTLSGLLPIDLPQNDVCGTGSLFDVQFTTLLVFSGGSLGPGESCTFSTLLSVPGGVDDGDYVNRTSPVSASIDGNMAVVDPASDTLTINSDLMVFTKEFTDDPVAPGGMVTLEFNITNQDDAESINDINFTDDLDAALEGLVATGLPASDVCGTGSTLSGTDTISLTGGSLAASETCTFSVVLSVPGSVPLGTVATNVTSEVTGQVGGMPMAPSFAALGGQTVTGQPATDDLLITFLSFEKAFDNPAFPDEVTVLTFTLRNEDGAASITDLDFTDDLDSVLAGLVATGLPLSDVCGTGSQIDGTSFLTFTGGNLPPGGTCAFDVDLQVPAGAMPGTFTNTTSALIQSGLEVALPATDDLVVEAKPSFAKVFAPDVIEVEVSSTLTFTIDNTASGVDATDLAFTDNLPAGTLVANPTNAASTCGGMLGASPGDTVLSFAGGTVAAGSTCTVQVDITSADAGVYINTSGELTSSSGTSGTATDTLTVNRTVSISVTKTDGVTSANPGESLTYTLTVSNGGPSTDPAVGFVDTFPMELENCTYTSVASGGATGNTDGSGDIADVLFMPAGSSVVYTADCDIAADASGTLSNTATATPSGTDTDPSDDSATDDDTVLDSMADLSLELDVIYDPAVAATVQVYDLTVENAGPSTAQNAFIDQELPVGGYFLGAEPSSVDCVVSSGIALSCDLGDVDMGDVVVVSVGLFVDARFDGTLSTEALVGSDATDPDPANNEQDATTSVARPRSMIATTRADGTEVLAIVAKEADETIGIVVAEAAGGGNRAYSVTGQGFRTVALAEVPDFDDTSAPEIAALAVGFDGSALVDVVDADSLTLLGSHPLPGNWVPIDVVALDDFADTMAPELALLLRDLGADSTRVLILDAASGVTVADYIIFGGKSGGAFPIDMAPVESFSGGPVDELAVLTQDPEFEDSVVTLLEPEAGGVPNIKFLDGNAFPIAVEGLEDLGGLFGEEENGPEVAVLLRDVTSGAPSVEIFDAVSGASLMPIAFDATILPEVLEVVTDFAGDPNSELSVGGRQAMGLAVETRDAGSAAVVGTITIGGGPPLNLDLAVHPSFAGAGDPEMSVLFEILDTPTEVSVFDVSGGAPLFTFILP